MSKLTANVANNNSIDTESSLKPAETSAIKSDKSAKSAKSAEAKSTKSSKSQKSQESQESQKLSKRHSIEPSPTPAALIESLPSWMQEAVMEDGRIAFKCSKFGLKVGKLNDASTTLGKMLEIVEEYKKTLTPEQTNFESRPSIATLREKFVCIGFARNAEGVTADYEFAVILYDNGWIEYQSTGRRATFQLADCVSFEYSYNYPINEIDKTIIDKSLLEKESWVSCACLIGEERITRNLFGHNTPPDGDDDSDSNGGKHNHSNTGCIFEKTDNSGEDIDPDKQRQREEPVTAARIPTPEARILAQERQEEIKSIIAKVLPTLSRKQAELYKLHFEYEIPLAKISEMLGVAPTSVKHRLANIREKFREQIKRQTGEYDEEYLGD